MTKQDFSVVEPEPYVYRAYKTRRDVMLSEGNPIHVLERIDYSNGIKLYYQGATYPCKGFPTPEAVFNTNIAKRAFLMMLNPFMLINWKKNKARFERCASYGLQPHYLDINYMTPMAREINKLPLGETANIMAHIFEYDDAYRYRLQDLMSELDVKQLRKNPRKECKHLLKLAIKRERSPAVKDKLKRLRIFAWLLIPFKSYFLKLIKDIDFDNMKFDEADRYWVSLRGDYDFFGKTYEENSKGLEKPPQYLINPESVV